MHRGHIEGDNLILTDTHMPEGIPEGTAVAEPDLEAGDKIAIPLAKLSEIFPLITDSMGMAVNMHPKDEEKGVVSRLFVVGLSAKDIFNAAAGYQEVDGLSVNIPMGFVFGDIDEDKKGKPFEQTSKGFIHTAITQAVEKGQPSEDRENTIAFNYEGWLPDDEPRRDFFAHKETALVAAGNVEKIEDKGAYRDVTFKHDAGSKYRAKVHSPASAAELTRKLIP